MPNTGTGRTIFGPEIVVSNLLVYYDISNEKSYAGTGTTVETLTAYPAPNATLFGGVNYSSSFPQSVEFKAASSNYLKYNLVNFGTSFTIMSVVASTTPIWNDYGSLGGAAVFYGQGVPVNGFGMSAYPDTTPPYTGRRVIYQIQFMPGPGSFPSGFYLGDASPSDITKPNLYYMSWDQNTGAYVVGWNNNITTGIATPPPGRVAGDLPMNIGKNEQDYTNDRYMNMKVYSHMLYDRALTRNEILLNYQALKPKFNL